MEPPRFGPEPLLEIIAYLRARLDAGQEALAVLVPDPDLGAGRYAGELVEHAGATRVHRPWRLWVDLAERLGLRLLTPRAAEPGWVRLELRRLEPEAGWQRTPEADPRERYGEGSDFQRISKLEDPDFVIDMADALARAEPPDDARVLALGVNTGDELALLVALRPGLGERGRFVGVDHSASALAVARERFPPPRHRFEIADLAQLPSLALGRFDLVLCLNTLQSPGVDDRAVLRDIVQHHLGPEGSLVLGIPNCSYRGGEQVHGARMKNFSQPDLSLAIKGIAFYRRYLHQHRRRVFVTGKYHLLVTAVPQPRAREDSRALGSDAESER